MDVAPAAVSVAASAQYK
uniref:Uncharacterized protein n=1 Tax=Arundo donax TaxID=35708 RepID=A0A0A8YFE6_ARUDO